MATLHVDSEVGRLQRVLLHWPGLELRRLTPSSCGALLALAREAVAADERNVDTDTKLRQAGVEVVTTAGSELGRGRGGTAVHELPDHPGPGLRKDLSPC